MEKWQMQQMILTEHLLQNDVTLFGELTDKVDQVIELLDCAKGNI